MTRSYSKCPILEAARQKRRLEMAALFRAGRTMAEVGAIYGMTGEAIRQHLVKAGIATDEGGKSINAYEQRSDILAKKNEAHLRFYGCTTFQLNELKRLRKPIKAYKSQKSGARERGIDWELNLWQWWTIWQESGCWQERGRCSGQFVMCRHGDDGPYAIGNVYIATTEQNIRDGYINRGFNLKRIRRRYQDRVAA